MSSLRITLPNKEALLKYKYYLQWRNKQIRDNSAILLKQGEHPYPILMKHTGLSWQALWQIIHYNK